MPINCGYKLKMSRLHKNIRKIQGIIHTWNTFRSMQWSPVHAINGLKITLDYTMGKKKLFFLVII